MKYSFNPQKRFSQSYNSTTITGEPDNEDGENHTQGEFNTVWLAKNSIIC